MQRAIELAELGKGSVSPNPMVGAVVVHEGKIIGEGWHAKYGEPHAEPRAILDVLNSFPNGEELLKQSTLYVTLEPCSHYGKTPPCADLIVKYRIPKVVIACRDPFERVNGQSIAKLKDAGVEIIEDVLTPEAAFMNRRFLTRVRQHRPYIILKWAQTANNYFAPKEHAQQWISGTAAKMLAHRWRSEEDAVLVGTNTARIDNPQLTVRDWKGRNPKRVVIDKHLSLSHTLHLFDGEIETIIFNGEKTEWNNKLKYVALENFDLYLPQNILFQLHLMDVQSLIIEGGAKTLQLFIDAGLWDEARVFKAPIYWEDGIKAPELKDIPQKEEKIGKDMLTTYFNH